MAMSEDLTKLMQDDELLQKFLASDFDPRQLASSVVQARVVGESLEKLATGIRLIDKELHAQVVTHHADLLSQATGIETLESVLHMMQTRINSLKTAIERISSYIVEPYEKVMVRTTQLQRLQVACDLLRNIIRIIYLVKRLHGQLQGGVREIAKAAQSVNELLELADSPELRGIHVVEKDRSWIHKKREEIEQQAHTMLSSGLDSQNPSQIGTALQVFYNLDCLQRQVEIVCEGIVGQLQTTVRRSLDAAEITREKGGGGGPGRVNMPSPGSTAAWRATLWMRLEQLIDTVSGSFKRVYQLQKVLAKKKDPGSQVCFVEELSQDSQKSSLDHMWTSTVKILQEELAVAAQASIFVKHALESEYPKLLRLFNDLWEQLRLNTPISIQSMSGLEPTELPRDIVVTRCLHESDAAPFKDVLSPFESAYIAKSLSRLLDAVNVVFPANARSPPSKHEIIGIVKTVTSELSVVSFDVMLQKTVAGNVEKTMKMFAAKCERLVATGSDAKQVSGSPSAAQRINIAVVNDLNHLCEEIQSILASQQSISESGRKLIESGLEAASSLMQHITDVIIEMVASTIEEILITMHESDFSGDIPTQSSSQLPESPCSAYIVELRDFISRIHLTHLVQYDCQKYMEERLKGVANRAMDLFVRHVTLIRPLGDRGKMRLAADLTEIEVAIMPLCQRPTDLGPTYQMLRSLKVLLFSAINDMPSNPVVKGEKLPKSVILHFLFSSAPKSLQSPHQLAGWNIRQYSSWLDEHPLEDDRLAMISATIDSYVRTVRSQGQKEFPVEYLTMVHVLTPKNE
ncbi:conserved oligomeric Golgi complex subunit 5-like [Corticium candelabrum]|uniref:conserved oligomeric Golgi complex subunit 5-like n=1 Tax=Corticium candelabrum TaxID=121492 RepID=UPI002E25F2B3|nr:conserved oligomeric Golgi complex subunit 5-like [Corticium candelabrum]